MRSFMFSLFPWKKIIYFNTADVKCRVASVKYLRMLHHSVIFFIIFFLGFTEPIPVSWKIEICIGQCIEAYAALRTTLLSYEESQ